MTPATIGLMTCALLSALGLGYIIGADAHWSMGLRAGGRATVQQVKSVLWPKFPLGTTYDQWVEPAMCYVDGQEHESLVRRVAGGLALAACVVAVVTLCVRVTGEGASGWPS